MKYIYICIPFKSKAVSSRWEKDIESLIRLVDSVLCQRESNLKPHIVISGHDKPEIFNDIKYADSVTFVENINLPIPETIGEKNKDKQSKKKSALNKIFEMAKEDDYIFISDADDLVNCDLFREVEKKLSKDFTDLVFFAGYMYNKATKDLAYIDGVNSIFYKVCGSCIISKITKQDINNQFKFFYKLTNHTKFYEICVENNRKPYKFTFPAVLYMHDSILNFSSGNIYIKKMFEDYKADQDSDYIILNKFFTFKRLSSLQNSLLGKFKTVNKIIV